MERAKKKSSCLLTDQGVAWKLLAGIKLSSLHPNITTEDFYEEPEPPTKLEREEPEAYTVSKAMVCSLCDAKFETRYQQKAHYRLDWHRFNLKRRMTGMKSVTEEKFADLADDVSSISGSGDSSSSSSDEADMSLVSPDSHLHGNRGKQASPGRRKKVLSIHKYESEDDTDEDGGAKSDGSGRRHPRIYYENDEGHVVSIHRCIVHGKREAPSSHSDLISRTLKLLMNQKWAIIMTGGGHFAAAVYDGSEVVVHKTFHRYTVRAKRGTVQSVRDAQGNAPKSAGASIRRHNEAALNQEVQDLLASWKSHLDSCSRIFLRVPTYNKTMFYGGKNPALAKSDPRVVTIPFATRRATFKEVQRVWELLASVECHGSVADVETSISSPKEKTEWKKGRKPPKDEGEVMKGDGIVLDAILDRLEKQSLQDEAIEKEQQSNDVKKDQLNEGEDNEKEQDDVNLVAVDVVSSFDHLKQYEVANKKPKKKKKQKQEANRSNKNAEEEEITNELYTICRTGGLDKLELVLKKIKLKYSGLLPVTEPETQSEKNTTESSDGVACSDTTQQTQRVRDRLFEAGKDSLPATSHKSGLPLQTTESLSLASEHAQSPSEVNSVNNVGLHPACANQCTAGSSPSSKRTEITGEVAAYQEVCNSSNIGQTYVQEGDSNLKLDVQFQDVRVAKHETDGSGEGESIASNLPPVENQATSNTPTSVDKSGTDDSLVAARPGKEFFKFLNKSLDDMGYTFLHVAAEDGQRAVLYQLMESGADPGVKNKKGKPPFGCSLDKKTRDEFKRFRMTYPDRYDYERAQIPAPLTEEQEKEKTAKQAEKKRNARKAKRAREKEQKEAKEEQRKEEEKKKKEEEKKNWYSSLSDREKRALAAERRFAQQTASSTEIQRCWGCGSSLAGKVPFSYMDFRFCSMPCLKKHKQQKQ